MKCHVSCILRAHKDTDTGPKESPTSFPGSLSLRRAGTGWREPWKRGRGKAPSILGDPGADSGCEGKSKRAGGGRGAGGRCVTTLKTAM